MATVSLRVPDVVKERMDEHDEINWSAVIRSNIEDELERLESRRIGHAVATSERLSAEIDDADVEDENSAAIVREWRDARYGGVTGTDVRDRGRYERRPEVVRSGTTPRTGPCAPRRLPRRTIRPRRAGTHAVRGDERARIQRPLRGDRLEEAAQSLSEYESNSSPSPTLVRSRRSRPTSISPSPTPRTSRSPSHSRRVSTRPTRRCSRLSRASTRNVERTSGRIPESRRVIGRAILGTWFSVAPTPSAKHGGSRVTYSVGPTTADRTP